MDIKKIVKEITLKLYNTETRQKQTLKPEGGQPLKFYACGPTVYDSAHIGNFRTYAFEDLLKRTLKMLNIPVTQVMNITDIDDKTIKGSIRENKSLDEYTKTYKKAFFDDLKTLNIEPADSYPEATKYIEPMINMIQTLIDKGFAYQGDGSVYYAINKFKKYGRLSHLKLNELQTGASNRIVTDEYEKDNASDFVLWKGYVPERDGDIYWDSPFGKGRPGWHLECSTMAIEIFGPTVDLHAGGVDNIFPHHENEIAQSEAFTGEIFARHWVHSEHLIVENKKMSKSLGNFYTLRNLLDKGYTGREVRYLLLQTHYRSQLNFTMAGLEAARASLQRIDDFVLRLNEYSNDSSEVDIKLEEHFVDFAKALADDLNISLALSVIFDLVRHINALCDGGKISTDDAKDVLSLLETFDIALGVLFSKEKGEDIPKEVVQALQDRERARAEKKWAESDRLRDIIHSAGYKIEDSPSGPRLKKG